MKTQPTWPPSGDVQDDDDRLAIAIEDHVTRSLANGVGPSLADILDAIPDLPRRAIPLDAAISAVVAAGEDPATLRWRHPELVPEIDESLGLEPATTASPPETRAWLPSDLHPVARLGSGSAAEVVLARDPRGNTRVVKIARPDAVGDHHLAREAAMLDRIASLKGVPTVIEQGRTASGERYLVLTATQGRSIDTWASTGASTGASTEASRIEDAFAGCTSTRRGD